MNLDNQSVSNLRDKIKDSFRVHPNQKTLYIDVGGNIGRFKSQQHQLIYGRRGSGKSSLLIHYKNEIAISHSTRVVYRNMDLLKKLSYSDILIRLLLDVFQSMPSANSKLQFWIFKNKLNKTIEDLRELLNLADEASIKKNEEIVKGGSADGRFGPANLTGSLNTRKGRQSEFIETKIVLLERKLPDYREILTDFSKKGWFRNTYILIDDFYLLDDELQPDIIDYLYRFFRGTNFYLKIGSVKHRTETENKSKGVGVKPDEDIEEINLDRTFENFQSTYDYLSSILTSLGESMDIKKITTELFNSSAFEALVLASGGVPRDFLNIFVKAIDSSRAANKTKWLTPTHIWKGSKSLLIDTKLSNLRDDTSDDSERLEKLFRHLTDYCLNKRKKTAFLISDDDIQEFPAIHELILQLMDYKLIHVLETNTSAASGRKGRYEAYTLDFSLFMEPRLRNIDIVEFWKFDDAGRRKGVREAPTYKLEYVNEALKKADEINTEDFIYNLEN